MTTTDDLIDVQITNNGSIFSFRLMTQAAKDWVEENVQTESYQFMGSTLHVEHRYARDLAAGMQEAGLEIE